MRAVKQQTSLAWLKLKGVIFEEQGDNLILKRVLIV